jgi:Protein of unknown function (DUF3570)
MNDSLSGGACTRSLSSKVCLLSVWLLLYTLPTRTRAENRADYRYEDYAEDAGRVHVQTHGFYFANELRPWLTVKANFLYDAISGATPTGVPPLPGQSKVATANIDDTRRAGFVESQFKFANQIVTPQVAYSGEDDYQSVGLALNHSIELNEKNTTLSWGVSQSFDEVLPNIGEAITTVQRKDSTDLLLGVSQLVNPNTIVSANVTLGYAEGYLNDPYKRVLFDDFPYYPGTDPNEPNPYTGFPENRPNYKFRQVLFLSAEHYFEPVSGALQATYRFHHDDYGIIANTASLQWNQKVGKHVIVSPLFRFHTQTEADFYGTHFPGDPTDPETYPTPHYYSSDYRLSALNSFTYGITVSVHLHENVSLEFAYARYVMEGTDGVTSQDQYPSANVFTGGLTIWY